MKDDIRMKDNKNSKQNSEHKKMIPEDTPQKKSISSANANHHQIKHKKIQRGAGYGAWIVLAVVVVSFVAWPILSNSTRTDQNISFGSYRGMPINYSENYGLFNSNIHSLLNQPGFNGGTLDSYQYRNIFERAFFATVSQYGRYFFLRDRGNDVSRKEASTLIYEQFLNDGKLNRTAWNELQNEPNRLKNAQDIMVYAGAQNIWQDVYESMDLIHNKELELLVPTLGDFRRVSYLFYTVADFPETEVEKFYNQNSQLFQKQFLRRIVVNSKEMLQKVQEELESGGNFGELAQLYSQDVYSQNKGEYGYSFYYELHDFIRNQENIDEEQATQWTDNIFALEKDKYAGPYEFGNQWYFYQIKTTAEIQAEKIKKIAEQQQKEAGKKELNDSKEVQKTAQEAEEEVKAEEPKTGFAAVTTTVRKYIEDNELSIITNYLRKNLEILKSRAKSLETLIDVRQEDMEIKATFNKTSKFFGFSYSSESNLPLYQPLTSVFSEEGLATGMHSSQQFFEEIFSLQTSNLSKVMLLGMEKEQTDSNQKYIVFFRLEEIRDSDVRDFARSKTENLDSNKPLYNYYLNSLLTGGVGLELLNRNNLKQRFESAYNAWSTRLSQN